MVHPNFNISTSANDGFPFLFLCCPQQLLSSASSDRKGRQGALVKKPKITVKFQMIGGEQVQDRLRGQELVHADQCSRFL